MPFRMGPTELIIVLVIVMMVFGVGRLPQVGSTIGKALKEFRHAQDEVEETTEDVVSSVNGKKSEEEKS